jgi:hypothetical protein
MPSKTPLLRDNAMLKEATDLAGYMYGEVLKQFGDFSEEKWNTESKIRRASNDVIFYIAQAVGGTTSDTTQYDWSSARKNLLSLQTMYVFANKQGFVELEPSIVTRIDKLIANIDIEIVESKKEIERKTKNEMEPWLEKYSLWKEMQDDNPKLGKK